MKLVIVVPAFNEAVNVQLFMERLSAVCSADLIRQVIFVDDGSSDGTREAALQHGSAFPVAIEAHERNMGVGQAFRTGFAAALRIVGPDDVILTIEADNTADINILPEMINRIEAGQDLVLASCYAPRGQIRGTNKLRMILSRGANILLWLAAPGQRFYTYSSFFRLYRGSFLRKAVAIYGDQLIQEPGFVCMVELLLKLSHLSDKIDEVPVVLSMDLRQGRSKMRILKTMLAYVRFIGMNLILSRRKFFKTIT